MRAALIPALLPMLAAASLVAAARAQPAAVRPDETALRYYAGEKQEARVAAETARLRRLHPGWQPPADLWTAEPGGEDEGPLWDLLSADRGSDLQAALTERARTEPGWKPSPALARAMSRLELRRTALALARAGRWSDLAATVDRRRGEAETGDRRLRRPKHSAAPSARPRPSPCCSGRCRVGTARRAVPCCCGRWPSCR